MLDPTRHRPQRQPMFNVPTVITVLAAVMIAVQLLRSAISVDADVELLTLLAFIPARYDPSMLPGGVWPGGLGADIWTFVTYAFLHGDFLHIGINLMWLLAFGSPVARRFGTVRFAAFFAVTAAAGAGLHLATHAGELVPMVGASASISGCMAAAIRFVFSSRGLAGLGPGGFESAVRAPAEPLGVALRDRRVLIFVAVWFFINIAFGIGVPAGLDQGSIAWQAHIGGFVAGLLLFPLFDPVPRAEPDPFLSDRRP
ncbi:rhomboid family intramembrane serine protease [Ancylobacter terrae]|uniref:rhomboid family intramembrane serine protease n=1 Tax=Ancylobacter sp. sgz301288 TaxID=3342077 RepID=UPI00385A08A8